ncbi:trypco2 family protein [Leifsonia sp. SIMBA_070]|uniref:trypco2 family protein n=1 Tax=Leifsonia sp. SIMBA_070 TaxID=3085810 RepID=UPI003979EB12
MELGSDVSDAIEQLRADLQSALEQGASAPLHFALGPIELTLELVASRQAGGKIGWSILGVDGSRSGSTTHSVKLTLQPMLQDQTGHFTPDFTVASEVDEAAPRFGP